MKLEDPGTQLSQSSPAFLPSPIVWMLHWTSALLVLFLLATSLLSGFGVTKRLYPSAWIDWHLSTGIALLAVTVLRMWISRPWKDAGRIFSISRSGGPAIRSILLFAVFLVTLSGLMIFQRPPFGRSGVLFGSFTMPTLIRLNHGIHNVIIDIHIVLSLIIAVLLTAHVLAGLHRAHVGEQSRFAAMLWPWR